MTLSVAEFLTAINSVADLDSPTHKQLRGSFDDADQAPSLAYEFTALLSLPQERVAIANGKSSHAVRPRGFTLPDVLYSQIPVSFTATPTCEHVARTVAPVAVAAAPFSTSAAAVDKRGSNCTRTPNFCRLACTGESASKCLAVSPCNVARMRRRARIRVSHRRCPRHAHAFPAAQTLHDRSASTASIGGASGKAEMNKINPKYLGEP